jgi:hypothetical protein
MRARGDETDVSNPMQAFFHVWLQTPIDPRPPDD